MTVYSIDFPFTENVKYGSELIPVCSFSGSEMQKLECFYFGDAYRTIIAKPEVYPL